MRTQGRSESIGVCFDILIYCFDSQWPKAGNRWDQVLRWVLRFALEYCSAPLLLAYCCLLTHEWTIKGADKNARELKLSHFFTKKNKLNSMSSQKDSMLSFTFISRQWYIILKAWFNLLFSKLCGIFLYAISQLLHVTSNNSPTKCI